MINGILNFNISLKTLFGVLVLIAGIFDAYKYRRQTQKLKRNKSSRNISRMFVFIAIICDIVIVLYTVIIKDFILIIIRTLSLYTMCELYYYVWKFYPYKNRKKRKFKKPNLILFLRNTLLPNNIRRHL